MKVDEIKLELAKHKLFSKKIFNKDSKRSRVDRLIEMSDNGFKSVHAVHINEGQTVEMALGSTEHIFTPSLNGGQAILVLQKSKLNSVIATLTHFDPTRIISNIHKLNQLIARCEKIIDSNSKAFVLLSVPAYLDEDQNRILFEEANKKLESAIQDVLPNSKIQKIPYNFNLLGCGKTFIASLGNMHPIIINVSIPECQYWQNISVA